MSNQSSNGASSAEAGDRANRARERRPRDEQLMKDARGGDAAAYRRLVDEWSANAFDRALHRGADERTAGEAVVRTFTQLQNELDGGDASFGARVMASVEQLVPSRPRALGKANRGAKRGAERLARGTDPAALGADPSISVMVWDALEVLGDRARDITDMHWRHGLASDEIAAATGESIFRVDDIIRKAPQGLAAALRTRLLWAAGKPDHDELTKDLSANNVRQFDSAAVRVIHAHLRGCSVCRSRSLIALPGVDIFAHIPIVALPGEVERRLSGTAWAPMQGGGAADAAAGATAGLVAGAADVVDAAPPADARSERPAETPGSTATPTASPAPAGPAPQPSRPTPAMASDTTTNLRERARNAARAGAAASAGAAAATAFSGAAAEASPLAPSADATSAPGLAPWTPPVDTAPTAPEPSTTTTVLPKVTPAAPEPATADAAGGRLEPVASQTAERGDRPKWLLPAGVVSAALVLIALIVVFTRGGGDGETAIDTGPSEQSTTTTRQPSSTTTTTRATTTSTAPPSTEAPSSSTPPTTSGGGPAPTAPPTTKPPAIVANVQYQMKPGNVKIGKPSGDAGSFFSWSVSANGPVTVSVTGPGVSSGDTSGGLTVCAPAETCGVGTHYFSIVVKDLDGRQVGAGTAKLVID